MPALAILDAFNGMFNRTFLMWEYRGRNGSLSKQADLMFKVFWGGIEGEKRARKSRS